MSFANDFKQLQVPDRDIEYEPSLASLRTPKGTAAFSITDPSMRKLRGKDSPQIFIAMGDVYGLRNSFLVVSIPGYGSAVLSKYNLRPGQLQRIGLSVGASRRLVKELKKVFAKRNT